MPQAVLLNLAHYERLSKSLTGLLSHTNKIIHSVGDDYLRASRYPIEQSQVPVLMFLYFLGDRSQQEIANDVRRDKSSIQRTVNILAKKGLLTVTPDSNDKRKNIVRLTDEGKKTCSALIVVVEEMDADVFKCLNLEEQTILAAILNKLISHNATWRTLNDYIPQKEN